MYLYVVICIVIIWNNSFKYDILVGVFLNISYALLRQYLKIYGISKLTQILCNIYYI